MLQRGCALLTGKGSSGLGTAILTSKSVEGCWLGVGGRLLPCSAAESRMSIQSCNVENGTTGINGNPVALKDRPRTPTANRYKEFRAIQVQSDGLCLPNDLSHMSHMLALRCLKIA